MIRWFALASFLVPAAAFGFAETIVFSPQVAGPGRTVTATISGLVKNPNVTLKSVTISGDTIVIDATAGSIVCGPACSYAVQATFNAPMQTGVYNVEYWLTEFDQRVLNATAQLRVANICDFGHSLTANKPWVYLHNATQLTWCSPAFSLTDFGYYVRSFRIYSSQAPDGPFTPLVDLPGNVEGPSAVVEPTAVGTTYYYVESHGCQGVITFCANSTIDTTMTSNIVPVNASIQGGCLADATTLCLGGGRFAVKARWTTPSGLDGDGHPVTLTKDSGYFWFFNSGNVEVTAKVLNACSLTPPAFWIFASGMTNVQVDLTVTDTQTKVTKHYTNPMGSTFATVVDTNSFFCP